LSATSNTVKVLAAWAVSGLNVTRRVAPVVVGLVKTKVSA
jgi:hypothetical protein